MQSTIYRFLLFSLSLALCACGFIFCKQSNLKNNTSKFSTKTNSQDICCNLGINSRALLSTRFKNLEHFKKFVSIKYDKDYSKLDSSECRNSVVNLCYLSNGEKIVRIMRAGCDQKEIMNLQKADNFTRSCFVLTNPNTIRQRRELEKAYILARRKPTMFGPGDISFYDLAETSYKNINTPERAFQFIRDSSEKGYINTFNHVTAQAIITTFFSEELADLIADLHERNNMPEITSGRFSETQLKDSINSPEDNYVDIINNEIGQKIGIKLKEKYKINENTVCTPVLLAAYLNDIQSYYMWALEIGLENFRSTDKTVIKFSNKINVILNGS